MRNKVAKKLKYTVMGELYNPEMTDAQRKAILKSPDFKKIYRARKKNYTQNKLK